MKGVDPYSHPQRLHVSLDSIPPATVEAPAVALVENGKRKAPAKGGEVSDPESNGDEPHEQVDQSESPRAKAQAEEAAEIQRPTKKKASRPKKPVITTAKCLQESTDDVNNQRGPHRFVSNIKFLVPPMRELHFEVDTGDAVHIHGPSAASREGVFILGVIFRTYNALLWRARFFLLSGGALGEALQLSHFCITRWAQPVEYDRGQVKQHRLFA